MKCTVIISHFFAFVKAFDESFLILVVQIVAALAAVVVLIAAEPQRFGGEIAEHRAAVALDFEPRLAL